MLAPDGSPATLTVTVEPLEELDGLEVVRVRHGQPVGLPERLAGVTLITSQLVARHASQRGRRDVVAPDTSPDSAIRENGRIVAVRRLARFDGA